MDKSRARVLPKWYSRGRFEGKTVVVTGAAQGIGQTVATRGLPLRAGSGPRRPVGTGVSGSREAGGRRLPTPLAVTADLETWEGAATAAARARDELGRIDVLINNVGGSIWFRPYQEFSRAEIEAEVRRSLFPTLWCCRAVLPYMIEPGAGTIVNVSSNATRGINRVPYAAAKGGVNAITTALAMEAAHARHPGRRDGTRRNRRPGTPDRARARAAAGPRTGVVPADRGPGRRLIAAQAVRDPGRAGRGDHLPRLRRGLLHHRDRAPCSRRRPRMIAGESNGDD